MIFQLPTGKIVHLSLAQYLNLTDEDVQYLISTGTGSSPNNPFYSSALSKKGVAAKGIEHDTTLDYNEDNEEVQGNESIDLDSLPDQDTL